MYFLSCRLHGGPHGVYGHAPTRPPIDGKAGSGRTFVPLFAKVGHPPSGGASEREDTDWKLHKKKKTEIRRTRRRYVKFVKIGAGRNIMRTFEENSGSSPIFILL